MNTKAKIKLLGYLGQQLKENPELLKSTAQKAIYENPWFTHENIQLALNGIADQYLDVSKLEAWMAQYNQPSEEIKTIGLVCAGNIPLVGMHDILSIFLSNNKALIKLSDKDKALPQALLKMLTETDPHCAPYFELTDRLGNYAAVIATGSNTTGQYFEKYFSHVPHIIRRNRNAVAVVTKETTKEDLEKLGHDIFGHFGLGCRNVSKIYIEEGIKPDLIFEAIEDFGEVINHNKYKNNYDYTYALLLMNNSDFLTNNFLILNADPHVTSRISTVNYEYFKDVNLLKTHLQDIDDQIQCVVTNAEMEGLRVVPFGQAQCPTLTDYADGVDTMSFLCNEI